MDYQLWQSIGEEFLIKSNINDWIFCKPNDVNGGSIVRAVHGDISCVNIKNVATCQGANHMKFPGRATADHVYMNPLHSIALTNQKITAIQHMTHVT